MSFQELIGFLHSPSSEVSRIALENLLPITPSSAGQTHLFKQNDFQGVKTLKNLALESKDTWTVQNAIIALVNLTDDAAIRSEIAEDANAVIGFAKLIVLSPKVNYARYACMSINNISREMETLESIKGPLLTAIALTTAKPDNISDEDFDFVVFAFAEFARQDSPAIAKSSPYMYVELSSGSLNRRKAIASTIKNSLFDVHVHEPLATDTPLIEAIMIRLKGPEPMDKDDFAQSPKAVRNESNEHKQREPDSQVILSSVESSLLLSSSQIGRDMLRQKKAYFVIRELHNVTKDSGISMACENFANMTMRGDPNDDDGTNEDIRVGSANGDDDENENNGRDDDDDEGVQEVI